MHEFTMKLTDEQLQELHDGLDALCKMSEDYSSDVDHLRTVEDIIRPIRSQMPARLKGRNEEDDE